MSGAQNYWGRTAHPLKQRWIFCNYYLCIPTYVWVWGSHFFHFSVWQCHKHSVFFPRQKLPVTLLKIWGFFLLLMYWSRPFCLCPYRGNPFWTQKYYYREKRVKKAYAQCVKDVIYLQTQAVLVCRVHPSLLHHHRLPPMSWASRIKHPTKPEDVWPMD